MDLFDSDLLPQEPKPRLTEADFIPTPPPEAVAASTSTATAHDVGTGLGADGEFPAERPAADDDAWVGAHDEPILPQADVRSGPRTPPRSGAPRRATPPPAEAVRPSASNPSRLREVPIPATNGRAEPEVLAAAEFVWVRPKAKSIFDIIARDQERAAQQAERRGGKGGARRKLLKLY